MVTRRFRWGASVESRLNHFTTPEIVELRRHCRKLIRDFCNPELEGEGYRATRIAFEMFHHGFVLAYDFGEDHWVLEVWITPNYGDPDCPRKPPRPRRDGGSRRSITNDMRWRRFRAALQRLHILYNTLSCCLTLTAIWAGNAAMQLRRQFDALISSTPQPHAELRAYTRLINCFTEQQSSGRSNLVRLVRLTVNDALSFLGPVSTYGRLESQADELWDSALFGEAEAASG